MCSMKKFAVSKCKMYLINFSVEYKIKIVLLKMSKQSFEIHAVYVPVKLFPLLSHISIVFISKIIVTCVLQSLE